MGKFNNSAATAKMKSLVRCKSISPKLENRKDATTIGITLDAEGAKNLAATLLACAYDQTAFGEIHLTGRRDCTVSVIRKIKGGRSVQEKAD